MTEFVDSLNASYLLNIIKENLSRSMDGYLYEVNTEEFSKTMVEDFFNNYINILDDLHRTGAILSYNIDREKEEISIEFKPHINIKMRIEYE